MESMASWTQIEVRTDIYNKSLPFALQYCKFYKSNNEPIDGQDDTEEIRHSGHYSTPNTQKL